MITTRAVPALLPAHHRRVARPRITLKDFTDPLADGLTSDSLGANARVLRSDWLGGLIREYSQVA